MENSSVDEITKRTREYVKEIIWGEDPGAKSCRTENAELRVSTLGTVGNSLASR